MKLLAKQSKAVLFSFHFWSYSGHLCYKNVNNAFQRMFHISFSNTFRISVYSIFSLNLSAAVVQHFWYCNSLYHVLRLIFDWNC